MLIFVLWNSFCERNKMNIESNHESLLRKLAWDAIKNERENILQKLFEATENYLHSRRLKAFESWKFYYRRKSERKTKLKKFRLKLCSKIFESWQERALRNRVYRRYKKIAILWNLTQMYRKCFWSFISNRNLMQKMEKVSQMHKTRQRKTYYRIWKSEYKTSQKATKFLNKHEKKMKIKVFALLKQKWKQDKRKNTLVSKQLTKIAQKTKHTVFRIWKLMTTFQHQHEQLKQVVVIKHAEDLVKKAFSAWVRITQKKKMLSILFAEANAIKQQNLASKFFSTWMRKTTDIRRHYRKCSKFQKACLLRTKRRIFEALKYCKEKQNRIRETIIDFGRSRESYLLNKYFNIIKFYASRRNIRRNLLLAFQNQKASKDLQKYFDAFVAYREKKIETQNRQEEIRRRHIRGILRVAFVEWRKEYLDSQFEKHSISLVEV